MRASYGRVRGVITVLAVTAGMVAVNGVPRWEHLLPALYYVTLLSICLLLVWGVVLGAARILAEALRGTGREGDREDLVCRIAAEVGSFHLVTILAAGFQLTTSGRPGEGFGIAEGPLVVDGMWTLPGLSRAVEHFFLGSYLTAGLINMAGIAAALVCRPGRG